MQTAKILAYYILLVLLLQCVQATELFSGEVKDNVAFTIEGVSHVARYYPSAKKVSMLAGTDRKLIGVGECEAINSLKYCIDSATEGYDDETGSPMSTMQVRVVESGPQIEIDREVSTEEPKAGQEVEITATIKNTGNERAVNVNYEDKFPSGVKVTGSSYNAISNGIIWAGSLNPNQSQTISYKLIFQDFIKLNSTAEASFIFNNKVSKFKSDTVNFDVKTPYKVSDSISSKTVGLNEEITYSMSISANGSTESVDIKKYEVILPKDVTVSYRELGLDVEQGKIVYTGSIAAGSAKNLTFKFKSSKITEGTLAASIELRSGSKTFTEKFSYKIGIGVSEVMPDISFNPTTVKGGRELEVDAKVTNNGDSNVSEISIDMTSDLVGNSGWRHISLAPGRSQKAFNKIINAPSVEQETKYYLMLSGSYRTKSGSTMNFMKKEEVTILPQEAIISMTPEFIVTGRDVNVTLKVKNVAAYKLTYVSLIDTVPKGFKDKAGSRYIDIDSLDVGEEQTAYSYVITVPDTYTKDAFEITHVFSGLGENEEKVASEKKSNVTISGSLGTAGATSNETGAAGKNTTSASNATSGTEIAGEMTDENPGIFTRMWRWVKGLFSSEPEETFE